MENFKINNFDNQEREQNGFEEFETLSLGYLNGEDRFSKEDRAEIELSREKNSIENREQLLDIYDKIETSGRENSSVFDGRKEVESNVVYFENYGAGFETFGGRSDFTFRPNLEKTQDQLTEELELVKDQHRVVSFKQIISNSAQAIGLKKVS